MGKLRVEPKGQLAMPRDKYDFLLGILKHAWEASGDNKAFWDMDEKEDSVKIRKQFLYVAEKESIPVSIRRLRTSKTLQFEFGEAGHQPKRIKAEEARKRIMATLKNQNEPMTREDIVTASGIKPSTWGLRIGELVKAGSVRRVKRVLSSGKPAVLFEAAK